MSCIMQIHSNYVILYTDKLFTRDKISSTRGRTELNHLLGGCQGEGEVEEAGVVAGVEAMPHRGEGKAHVVWVPRNTLIAHSGEKRSYI